MAYTHADIVWTIPSPDGKRAVDMLARHDGLFEFHENVLTLHDHVFGPEEVWMAGYSSGLFQTQGEAEREARKAIGWMEEG